MGGSRDEARHRIDEEASLVSIGGHGIGPCSGRKLRQQGGVGHRSEVGSLRGASRAGHNMGAWIPGSRVEDGSGILPLPIVSSVPPSAAILEDETAEDVEGVAHWGVSAMTSSSASPLPMIGVLKVRETRWSGVSSTMTPASTSPSIPAFADGKHPATS